MKRAFAAPTRASERVVYSYNIPPCHSSSHLLHNPDLGHSFHSQHLTAHFLCGLSVPSWAEEQKIAYRTVDARVETIDTTPSYREAFKKRRCLIPADGFYEWKRADNLKQPYSISETRVAEVVNLVPRRNSTRVYQNLEREEK